jgi:hypothetical protein
MRETATAEQIFEEWSQSQEQTNGIDELLRLSGLSALIEGVSLAKVEQALRKLAEMLDDDDDKLRRATVRAATLAALKSAKIEGAASLIDAAFKVAPAADSLQGQELILRDPDPWPEAVN